LSTTVNWHEKVTEKQEKSAIRNQPPGPAEAKKEESCKLLSKRRQSDVHSIVREDCCGTMNPLDPEHH
jgi:hypothetical protein